MEKFIIANNVAFRYLDQGTGVNTILLLHGYLESLEVWENITDQLSKTYRVISLDLPGHGISEVIGDIHTMSFLADTVNALLEKIGVATCFVAGHSMGGYVALEFAKKFPVKVDGLIMVHSIPNGDTQQRKENRLREIALIKAGKKDSIIAVNPAMRFAPENRVKFEDQIQELIEMATLTEDDGVIAILNGIMLREDYSELMSQWKIPKLMIFGCHDDFISTETAEQIIAKNPDAQVVWLKDSGHMGFIEQPQETLLAIEEFIENNKK